MRAHTFSKDLVGWGCIAAPVLIHKEGVMAPCVVAAVAVFLLVTPMVGAVDPVFMTGIVAICAIVVFALAVVTVAIFSPSGSVAKEALKTLVALIRSLMA